jgi:hypothetical protein
MDDLTANNETVLVSLSGAPTVPESKNEKTGGEAMGLEDSVRGCAELRLRRTQSSRERYRSDERGRERRFSEKMEGVRRQRAGSHRQ